MQLFLQTIRGESKLLGHKSGQLAPEACGGRLWLVTGALLAPPSGLQTCWMRSSPQRSHDPQQGRTISHAV